MIRPDVHLPYAGPISEFAPLPKVLEAPAAGSDNRLRIYRLYVRAYVARLDLRARKAAEASGNPLVYWRWALVIHWTRVKLEWQGLRYALGWSVDRASLQDLVAELGDPLG